MYSTGGQEEHTSSELNPQFLRDFCRNHGDRLVRLAVFRLYVTRDMLQLIANSFPNLEQLYVSIAQRDFVSAFVSITELNWQLIYDPLLSRLNLVTAYRTQRNYAQYTLTLH